MRPRISIRGCVRPSVRPSVGRSVRPSVGPSVHPSVTHELKPCKSAVFDQKYYQYQRERILWPCIRPCSFHGNPYNFPSSQYCSLPWASFGIDFPASLSCWLKRQRNRWSYGSRHHTMAMIQSFQHLFPRRYFPLETRYYLLHKVLVAVVA